MTQGWYYVESLTGQRHDRVQTESQITTVDSCFDLVGSLQHGVASCEVFSWSSDIHKLTICRWWWTRMKLKSKSLPIGQCHIVSFFLFQVQQNLRTSFSWIADHILITATTLRNHFAISDLAFRIKGEGVSRGGGWGRSKIGSRAFSFLTPSPLYACYAGGVSYDSTYFLRSDGWIFLM